MKKILIVALFSLWLAGCGNGSENRFGGHPSTGTVNLAGTWQISLISSKTSHVITGSLSISQSGTTVSGQANLTGSPCATGAPMSGSISGSMVQLILQMGSQALMLTGSVNSAATSITGTYTAPSGGCLDGDTGTWTANKT